MNARALRTAAIAVCIGMAVVIVALQFALTPDTRAPTFLFIVFTGLWAFGALMLSVAPVFGAVGTTLWGLISAVGAWRTHEGVSIENSILIGGSLAAAALAAAYLVARSRAPDATV